MYNVVTQGHLFLHVVYPTSTHSLKAMSWSLHVLETVTPNYRTVFIKSATCTQALMCPEMQVLDYILI